MPFESTLIPGGFGILCLIAAVGILRRRSWATVLAALLQLLVLAMGVIGLMDNRHPLLWLATALGVLGLLLLRPAVRR